MSISVNTASDETAKSASSKALKAAKTSTKSSKKKKVQHAIVHILASFNNTIITVTDLQGHTLDFNSAGREGFKHSRKSTPFAAQVTAQNLLKRAHENFGIESVDIVVKGAGGGREAAPKAIVNMNEIHVKSISDATGIPHNGPTPPKERRV